MTITTTTDRRARLSARVTGRIDSQTKAALAQIAADTGLDESDLVRLALRQFLPAITGADLERPPVLTGVASSNCATIVSDRSA
jgi:hypothetical protein